MIDLKLLREDPENTISLLKTRGVDENDLRTLMALDKQVRELKQLSEAKKREQKECSKQIADIKRQGSENRELQEKSKQLSDDFSKLNEELRKTEEALVSKLLLIPNLPDQEAPEGLSDADNRVIEQVIKFENFKDYQRMPHWEIGKSLDILDLERGAKISGSMFPVFKKAGAQLLRALTFWALTYHGSEFEEIRPPYLVRSDTLKATGHLPKFSDEAYHIERDDLWAIPTAEVPLTSLYKDEILNAEDLPKRFTAYTSCFRREAGAAGRDTRGLLRVHEFDKVEILALSTPEQAKSVHGQLLERAQVMLDQLGLNYRTVDLCRGDLGNSSKRTFDLEVYAPGCDQWLEVSSVSWFGDYQARRANIRFRNKDNKIEHVHTLNGSALAWPRIWAAIVENYRTDSGTIRIPEIISVYLNGATIINLNGELE
jgi:seryl-tRNA synthetase